MYFLAVTQWELLLGTDIFRAKPSRRTEYFSPGLTFVVSHVPFRGGSRDYENVNFNLTLCYVFIFFLFGIPAGTADRFTLCMQESPCLQRIKYSNFTEH